MSAKCEGYVLLIYEANIHHHYTNCEGEVIIRDYSL